MLRLLAGALLAIAGSVSPVAAVPVSVHLTPTSGQTNEAIITLKPLGTPLSDTAFIEATSTLDLDYDLSTNELTLTDASLDTTNVHYGFLIGPIDAENINVSLSALSNTVVVDPLTGVFSNVDVETWVTADIYYNGTLVLAGPTLNALQGLAGTFQMDPFGNVTVTNVTATIPTTEYFVGPISVELSGSLTLNFSGNAPDVVFHDGFDDGGVAAWTSHTP